MRTVALFPLVLLVLCSCRMRSTSESEVKIVGPQPMTSDNPGNLNAVGLTDETGRVFCTGSLIAENLVLTAAHCLVEEGAPVSIRFDSLAQPTPVMRPVTDANADPDFNLVDGVDANFDIAWVKFSGGLPPGFTVLPILRDVTQLKAGTTVIEVGYGKTSTSGVDGGTKRTTSSIVYKYLDDNYTRGIVLTGPIPNKGACFGDSGGPLYVQVGDVWYIAGTLHGNGLNFLYGLPDTLTNCESGINNYALPLRYIAWLAKTSQANLGYAPPLTSEWGVGSGAHTSFEDWCKDRQLDQGTWRSIHSLLLQAQTLNCTLASKIQKLDLDFPAAPKNFNWLAGLYNLQTLSILRDGMFDLTPVGSLTSLQSLDISGNDVVDLRALRTLSHLKYLNISSNQIVDLSPLSGLTTMQDLECSDNQIVDIAPIAQLPLTKINLQRNRVSDLSPFSQNSSIQALWLFGNPLSNQNCLLPNSSACVFGVMISN